MYLIGLRIRFYIGMKNDIIIISHMIVICSLALTSYNCLTMFDAERMTIV